MATVLVIDPLKSHRAMTADTLSMSGHTVVETATAKGAIAALRDLKPDCVVTSLPMPGLNDDRFLGCLRNVAGKVPILVLAEDAECGGDLSGERFPVSGLFLDKPVRAEDLQASVERALARGQGVLECV